ncbi:MAG: UDP-N-acetylmuramate--L-alanine ligase [Candidatus Omnitrophica bacterium]|nr:UDP-N-acetylmuramate--L-alanine ligase [Candidatus Omnitrophota bacterium]
MSPDALSRKRFHFVGIGGIGMSGLAHLLLAKGRQVSGSDVKRSSLLSRLEKEGAKIFIGHRREHITDAEVLIYSSCIRPDNPEREEAAQRSLLSLSRGELLSLLFKEKRTGVAVSGSHGKTTTTALAAWLLRKGGLDPSFLIGGVSHNLDGNAAMGRGDYFVTEADESDGSFLALTPTYSIVTNMDAEHLDFYETLEKSLDAYAAFLDKTKGTLFVSSDCPNTQKVLKKLGTRPIVTFGLTQGAHYFPTLIEREGRSSRFDCIAHGERLGSFLLNLPGLHNITNALAVIALGGELEIPVPVLQEAIETFDGVQRRLEMKQFPALTIVEDYAHHPAEIEATLEALRGMGNGRRIVSVFQPHRYTRTRLLAERFGSCFQNADLLIVTEIYAASEAPIPGVDAETILGEVRRAGKNKELLFVPKKEIISRLLEILRPKDILVVMGAGDVGEVAREMSRLCSQGTLSWIHRPSETT